MNSLKSVLVKNIRIGGKAPIIIQSMVNTNIEDTELTLKQINELYNAGAQLIRVGIINKEQIKYFKKITEHSPCPIIADIHFDYKLAILAMNNGAAKIRINPGNIAKRNLLNIINEAKKLNIPIRIGINSGSLQKDILEKYNYPSAEALVESALKNIRFFEENGFDNIVISIKSSDVLNMIKANELLFDKMKYPIHLGITEAGGSIRGIIKNSMGIGYLLIKGIGDTIRVSLSENPVEEIKSAKILLKSLHLYKNAPDIISCPTCSRTTFDVIKLSRDMEKMLENSKANIKIAIMGCIVNGPGEAKEADIGITGSRNQCIVFKKGKIVFKGKKQESINFLIKEVKKYEKQN